MKLLSTGCLAAVLLRAQAPVPDVARLLADVIRIDTSNPPGNEGKLAEFLKTRLAPLGFEIDIVSTPQAGKAHFVARLRGDGSKRPVLIAAHEDVVGVEREKWTVDPFAGVIKDGYVYGRGAIDFKGGLAIFAQAVMDIARQKRPLARDIIFVAEADEEGGLYGTRYLAEKAWEKIDCEFALNEGGWIIKDSAGKVQYVSISTADKSSVSLLLTARGTSTHSSMPRPDNAIFTLGRALAKLSTYDTQPRLTESTREFFLPAVARHHAEHHRAGVVERRFPRQRHSGVGRGYDQLPHDSRHHAGRIDRRGEARHRRSARRDHTGIRVVDAYPAHAGAGEDYASPACDGARRRVTQIGRALRGARTAGEAHVSYREGHTLLVSGGHRRRRMALARRPGLRHLPVSDQRPGPRAHARQRRARAHRLAGQRPENDYQHAAGSGAAVVRNRQIGATARPLPNSA